MSDNYREWMAANRIDSIQRDDLDKYAVRLTATRGDRIARVLIPKLLLRGTPVDVEGYHFQELVRLLDESPAAIGPTEIGGGAR